VNSAENSLYIVKNLILTTSNKTVSSEMIVGINEICSLYHAPVCCAMR
jgi:hypothetical protein